MHFHSRCNVDVVCSSIMSLHMKFRCGLGSPDRQANRRSMESASHLFRFPGLSVAFFFVDYKQTGFPEADPEGSGLFVSKGTR